MHHFAFTATAFDHVSGAGRLLEVEPGIDRPMQDPASSRLANESQRKRRARENVWL